MNILPDTRSRTGRPGETFHLSTVQPRLLVKTEVPGARRGDPESLGTHEDSTFLFVFHKEYTGFFSLSKIRGGVLLYLIQIGFVEGLVPVSSFEKFFLCGCFFGGG